MCRPPSSSAFATISCWLWREALVRSKCMWFLAGLRLLARDETDPEPGVIVRHERGPLAGVGGDRLPAQDAGPEAREPGRVVGVEAQRDEPRRHFCCIRSAD